MKPSPAPAQASCGKRGFQTFIAVLGLLGAESAQCQPAIGNEAAAGAGIPWFATLDRGLAEAKRSGKPILFVSAAPHCAGVSGMW